MRSNRKVSKRTVCDGQVLDPVTAMSNLKSLTILDLVDEIVNRARNSSLSPDFYAQAEPFLNILCERQKVSKEEGVMLSLLVNSSIDGGADLSGLARYIDCTHMQAIKLKSIMKGLVVKQLVEVSKTFSRLEYAVTDEVLEAYCENKPYFPPSLKVDTDEELLSAVFDMNYSLNNRGIEREMYSIKLNRILDENEMLPIMRHLAELGVEELWYESAVLQLCCNLFFEDEKDTSIHDLMHIFPDGTWRNQFLHEMHKGKGILFENGIVQHGMTSVGMVNCDIFQLTEKAVKKLLPSYRPKRSSSFAHFIDPEKIAKKELFFAPKVKEQIETLRKLLDNANFQQVQKRLVDNGFRKGFCCLFYGAPGTGKTALAQELARLTGRKLMQIDLSTVRDKWVGESEKNVQGIFDDYKGLLEESEKAPILLFNEADGLLTTRVKTEKSENASVDNMENTMQNILLQNMEDFEGIMIATTNLVTNMDTAFERRFLYKVEFPKPDVTVRANIWHSLMPKLDVETVNDIADRYDLSGGQIENIVRKSFVDTILFGDEDKQLVKRINSLCSNEIINKKAIIRRVGFCA